MSPPFAFSYRRRSHSASSPSPSPVPVSSWRSAHKRAHSSHRDTPTLPDAQRCHLDIWRTGKRARRDVSPPHATRSSTPASAHSTASSSSTPHTPLFPASSADFLLFSSHSPYKGNPAARNPHSPSSAVTFLHDGACESSQSELARLRSEAFSELQRSVQENGEGFVKRMREFEDSRSKSTQHSRPRGIERRRKKRYSPGVSTFRFTEKTTVSDDDDVLIFSSNPGSESSHPRQKRSSSLGAMDDTDLQSHETSDSSGRLSPISSTFHSFPYYIAHIHPGTASKSLELSPSSTSFDFTSLRNTNTFRSASHPSSDSLPSSADVCLSSSYTETVNHSPSAMLLPLHTSSPGGIPTFTSSAEKEIAALTLAMANGAGSLGDYEAVRALNVLPADESQVGELWH